MLTLVFRRAALSILCVAALACLLPAHVFATTVAVFPPGSSNCTNLASYSTISDAVAHVPAGSTIKICPGTYNEQVVITSSLTLIGESATGTAGATASGPNNPVIASPMAGVALNAADLFTGQPIGAQILVAGGTVNISNITVDGTNNNVSNEGQGACYNNIIGILYQNASGTLDHVVARYQELPTALFGCQDGDGIFAQSTAATVAAGPTLTIENSSVHDYDKNGITAVGDMTISIKGNYVVGIGATTLIAQNGIQVSYGSVGNVENNTVTDDVYINPADCQSNDSCYAASAILIYDTAATEANPVTISGNTVSNAQLPISTSADSSTTADWNAVTSNKITYAATAGPYQDDAIDLCSNNNKANSNTIFNASGAGVHLDSSCTEGGNPTGLSSTAASNTVNEACAGVLTGDNAVGVATGTVTYNVVEVTSTGDTCPAGNGSPDLRTTRKSRPQLRPIRH